MGKADDNQLEPQTFEEQARLIVTALKSSFTRMIDEVGVSHEFSPTLLARAMKIDVKLAWKVLKVVQIENPFEAGQYVPGATAAKRFIRIAKRLGATTETVAEVRRTLGDFQILAAQHGGGRRTLNALMASQALDGSSPLELEQRRAAFESNRYLWGFQARSRFKSSIIAPSKTPGMADLAVIKGHIDLTRLRHGRPWCMARSHFVHDEKEQNPYAPPVREPLEVSDDDVAAQLALMPVFCSDPLPQVEAARSASGAIEYTLSTREVGSTGAETLVSGEVLWAAQPALREAEYMRFSAGLQSRTPVEDLVFDVWVHEQLLGDLNPEVYHYSGIHQGDFATGLKEFDRLPRREPVKEMARGLRGVRTPEVPRYLEMVDCAFKHLGQNIDDFRVFRVRVRFPLVPTIYLVSFDLDPE